MPYLRAMSLRPDHKALVFLGAIAVLGAGVRVVRANSASADAAQPGLERQTKSADSAAQAARDKQSTGRGRSSSRAPAKRRSSGGRAKTKPGEAMPKYGDGPFDRPGYINGKLDLDVATAAQIDSLPGVGSTMAKRIVLDRAMRGPFVTRDGLRRVSGVGPAFLRKIDSLITFSGTVRQPSPTDTALVRNRAARGRLLKPPAEPQTGVRRPAQFRHGAADSYQQDRRGWVWQRRDS